MSSPQMRIRSSALMTLAPHKRLACAVERRKPGPCFGQASVITPACVGLFNGLLFVVGADSMEGID